MNFLLYRPRPFLRTLYWNGFRQRLGILRRRLVCAQPRGVPLASYEDATARYGEICRRLMSGLQGGRDLTGASVCELGAGNCLATTALFLGLGARQVDVFEPYAPVVDDRQIEVLKALKAQGLPLDVASTLQGDPLQLNEERIKWHRKFVEKDDGNQEFDFIFSFSVLEHVADLQGALGVCYRMLRPGGEMLHVVDLGGHGFFEDPMPPLDFQVYPDWLDALMHSRYGKVSRCPVSDYASCARSAGFKQVKAEPIRLASDKYLDEVWPLLNRRIKHAGRDDVRVIEFTLAAKKD